MTWWTKFSRDRDIDGKPPITTWTELKKHMRKRYVQPWYQRDMIKKLQRLTQGNKSVEDYYQELEASLHRVQIQENPEATMAHFLHGLRRDI